MEEFFIPAFNRHKNELQRESKAALKGRKIRIKALPALGAAPPGRSWEPSVDALKFGINLGMGVNRISWL